jgi:hypothetical protein
MRSTSRTLEVGGTHVFEVEARKYWNCSGVILDPDGTYDLFVAGEQFWFDWHNKSDANGYVSEKLRFWECFRRVTYATPHNGIDLRIVRNVPGWASFGDVNNFNREHMAKSFGLKQSDDVSVVENFPPEHIFNLVGTNPSAFQKNNYMVTVGKPFTQGRPEPVISSSRE